DVACFRRGADGAHLVRNATEEPARILMLSTAILPDIVEYPDSSKHYALSAQGELIFQTRYGEPARYWDGEA
ncbi:MAG: cupin domain-containing protein, partial [Gaiellaceae bacterium]